jgi:hypothetical protein
MTVSVLFLMVCFARCVRGHMGPSGVTFGAGLLSDGALEGFSSQTNYERSRPTRAARLARQAFYGGIDRSVGGPPRLPAPDGIGGYRGESAARPALDFQDGGVELSSLPVLSSLWEESRNFSREGECSGAPRFREVNEGVTYNRAIPKGEDRVEAEARDAARLAAVAHGSFWPGPRAFRRVA